VNKAPSYGTGSSSDRVNPLATASGSVTDAGSGPPIAFLHGYPFNRSMWSEQIQELSSRYRVIAPDLRGFGDTSVALQFVAGADGGVPKRQAEAYRTKTTMEEMARDVVALMDELEIDRAIVCGLSMGGYVALEFAHLFPSRVQALVLAGARAQGPDETEKDSREQQARRVLVEGMRFVADSMVPKLLAQRTLQEKPEIVSRVREMILTTKPQGAAAAQRGMAARRDYSSDLPDIGAPTLIIAGNDDRIRKPEDAEFIHRGISNSRLELIEDAGHLMNMEQPEAFNHAMMAFLEA